MLDIYKMLVAVFSMTDRVNRVRFFKEPFLIVNISLEIVFKMSFLTLSGVDINFLD